MSRYKCSLLVVDDEPSILDTLKILLRPEFDVLTADCAEAARRQFEGRDIDIILTDQKMPRVTGVQLLEWVREHHPRTIRLMMTGFAELEETISAINKGQVFRFLLKPWQTENLLDALRSAARTFILERSHEQLQDELRQLNDKLREMNVELENRVAERTKSLEEAYHELEHKNKMLEKLALTDPLTNLPNRRAMDRLAERELRRRERYPGSLAIGLIDVDHFKQINDRYLLPGGDRVLIDLARCLNTSVRTVDFLGRIGGEEFMVIAPETDMQGAIVLGERIRSTVEQAEFAYKDNPISVRVSIGFAVADAGVETDYETVKHLAAAALSEAKKTGRNRCVFLTIPKLPFEQAGIAPATRGS
ncbi:MAG TPA: diguanylate cyclase [Gemmataceae bacterium]|nr:diguanylate cyclase [Gemmataceae bacterium]